MKTVLIIFAIVAVVIGVGFMFAQPLLAHGPCDDVNEDGASSGMEYGLFHISSHAPHGPADAHHNPGSHQGYSLCL